MDEHTVAVENLTVLNWVRQPAKRLKPTKMTDITHPVLQNFVFNNLKNGRFSLRKVTIFIASFAPYQAVKLDFELIKLCSTENSRTPYQTAFRPNNTRFTTMTHMNTDALKYKVLQNLIPMHRYERNARNQRQKKNGSRVGQDRFDQRSYEDAKIGEIGPQQIGQKVTIYKFPKKRGIFYHILEATIVEAISSLSVIYFDSTQKRNKAYDNYVFVRVAIKAFLCIIFGLHIFQLEPLYVCHFRHWQRHNYMKAKVGSTDLTLVADQYVSFEGKYWIFVDEKYVKMEIIFHGLLRMKSSWSDRNSFLHRRLSVWTLIKSCTPWLFR
uniref:Uncharacterized protein n=1 Tax=Romanomermis culicivorax TaxID=13658 RepID=A0A915JMG2_ROMCU